MRDLLILGITPHAVEMTEMVARINEVAPTWNLLGLVAIEGQAATAATTKLPIFTVADADKRHPDACLVPVYEWPEKDRLPRERLVSLVDPSSVVASSATLGLGCVIFPHCYVGAHARIGDFLFCLASTVINHDDVLEDHVTLTSGVMVAGDVHIEAHCYLGQSSSVREFVRIGRGSMIGMGAVVLRSVGPNSVIVGNPGRYLRQRERNFPGLRQLRAARRLARHGLQTLRRAMPAQ
jgi:acetyltransferase-like isoleucine patch superfamily enzyme